MMLALASDHAGFALKHHLLTKLEGAGYEVTDFGCYTDAPSDYHKPTLRATQAVINGVCERGIFVCGNGFAMACLANRLPGARATICHDVFTARTSREMGNTNLISLGARVLGESLAWELTRTWLESEFHSDVARYARRNDRLTALEAYIIKEDWQTGLDKFLQTPEENV
jgi:ribose 5-phosphate isomerase B